MAEVTADFMQEDATQTQGNIYGLVAGKNATKNYLLWAQTVDAVTGKMSLDSVGADFLETEDNKTYGIEIMLVARDVAGQDSMWGQFTAVVTRGAGVATTLMPQQNSFDFYDVGTLAGLHSNVAITASAVDGSINIEVTGLAGVTINWAAQVRVVEVGTS